MSLCLSLLNQETLQNSVNLKAMPKMHSQTGIFHWLILLVYCICLAILFVGYIPHEDHIKCSLGNTNCTITNIYRSFPDRSICHAAEVVYPTTEEELLSIVANATFLQRKMKIATAASHSIPKLVCPDGENSLIISTKYLNRTVSLNKSAMTITVQTGMTLRQLINEITMAGLAIPYTPYWWGVTIGGTLGTGAHGSTLWDLGPALHDYVIQLRIVTPAGPDEGYAKVRKLEIGDPDLDAARVSLGVLGIISQVTLQLQPLFKRSMTFLEKDDSDFGDQVSTFGSQHEFADITWFPSQKKVLYRIDDRVPYNTTGDGVFSFMGLSPISSLIMAVSRTLEEIQEYTGHDVGKCITGALGRYIMKKVGYGLTNDGFTFKGYPVVGYHNRLQATGTCLDSPKDGLWTACAWDPRFKGLYYFQNGISISLSRVKDFIQDVQKLVALQPRALCAIDIYNGILIRYVTASKAYLGKQEDSLDFDITYYRSKDPMTPRLHGDIFEEIEQMAIFKYGGLPHWGKNRHLTFVGAINKYKNAGEFLKVKQSYDPLGLFSSEWTDKILGLKDGITAVKAGCASEGLCICAEDIHCSPKKGYFCRPGKVYKDARVCTHSSS